jgi:23S rRNA pseudouridine1911/1915/1917 synthase
MITEREFKNEEGGIRLDAALLLAFPSSTRAFVREAIERGDVLVNGRRAAKGLKLHGGETLKVAELLEKADNLVTPAGDRPHLNRPEASRLEGFGEISPRPFGKGDLSDARGASDARPFVASPLFKDASLLAFDKPAGMPVQPLTCRETGTLMNAVVAAYSECRALGTDLAALGENPLMAGALHRIDADTSGLVLVARTIEAFSTLRAQFAAQTVEKTYLALVEGSVPSWGSGSELPVTLGTDPTWTTLENDLVHDPTLPFCRMIDAHHNRLTRSQCAKLRPLHAVTQFIPRGQTLVENETRTLLEVKIFTGVTHQIRAQLALAGLHIVNDRLYGAFAVENQIGHCLHAYAAKFKHPATGEEITIKTDLPPWAKAMGTDPIGGKPHGDRPHGR